MAGEGDFTTNDPLDIPASSGDNATTIVGADTPNLLTPISQTHRDTMTVADPQGLLTADTRVQDISWAQDVLSRGNATAEEQLRAENILHQPNIVGLYEQQASLADVHQESQPVAQHEAVSLKPIRNEAQELMPQLRREAELETQRQRELAEKMALKQERDKEEVAHFSERLEDLQKRQNENKVIIVPPDQIVSECMKIRDTNEMAQFLKKQSLSERIKETFEVKPEELIQFLQEQSTLEQIEEALGIKPEALTQFIRTEFLNEQIVETLGINPAEAELIRQNYANRKMGIRDRFQRFIHNFNPSEDERRAHVYERLVLREQTTNRDRIDFLARRSAIEDVQRSWNYLYRIIYSKDQDLPEKARPFREPDTESLPFHLRTLREHANVLRRHLGTISGLLGFRQLDGSATSLMWVPIAIASQRFTWLEKYLPPEIQNPELLAPGEPDKFDTGRAGDIKKKIEQDRNSKFTNIVAVIMKLGVESRVHDARELYNAHFMAEAYPTDEMRQQLVTLQKKDRSTWTDIEKLLGKISRIHTTTVNRLEIDTEDLYEKDGKALVSGSGVNALTLSINADGETSVNADHIFNGIPIANAATLLGKKCEAHGLNVSNIHSAANVAQLITTFYEQLADTTWRTTLDQNSPEVILRACDQFLIPGVTCHTAEVQQDKIAVCIDGVTMIFPVVRDGKLMTVEELSIALSELVSLAHKVKSEDPQHIDERYALMSESTTNEFGKIVDILRKEPGDDPWLSLGECPFRVNFSSEIIGTVRDVPETKEWIMQKYGVLLPFDRVPTKYKDAYASACNSVEPLEEIVMEDLSEELVEAKEAIKLYLASLPKDQAAIIGQRLSPAALVELAVELMRDMHPGNCAASLTEKNLIISKTIERKQVEYQEFENKDPDTGEIIDRIPGQFVTTMKSKFALFRSAHRMLELIRPGKFPSEPTPEILDESTIGIRILEKKQAEQTRRELIQHLLDIKESFIQAEVENTSLNAVLARSLIATAERFSHLPMVVQGVSLFAFTLTGRLLPHLAGGKEFIDGVRSVKLNDQRWYKDVGRREKGQRRREMVKLQTMKVLFDSKEVPNIVDKIQGNAVISQTSRQGNVASTASTQLSDLKVMINQSILGNKKVNNGAIRAPRGTAQKMINKMKENLRLIALAFGVDEVITPEDLAAYAKIR